MLAKEQLIVPVYLNLPWLTERYVRLNAWQPVCHWVPDDKPEFTEHREWGIIPCKSRTEFRAGDVILFDEYNEGEDGGEYWNNRFYRVSQEHIDKIFGGRPLNLGRRTTTKRELIETIAMETTLLPVGVAVHPPA